MTVSMRPIVYINGEFLPASEARISPEDRGFLLGDGVFDTMRTYNGRIFRFAEHLERLVSGLAEIQLPVEFAQTGLETVLYELIARNGGADAVLRVTITRGRGAGGYKLDASSTPTVYIATRAVPDVASLRAKGVTLSFSEVQRPLPFRNEVIKSISCGALALARLLADSDEVLLCDSEGLVAEGASSSFFAIFGEEVITPPVQGILPGVTSGVIEEVLPVNKLSLRREDLLKADGLFIASTSTGPLAVRALGERAYRIDHPLMRKVYDEYDRIVERECASRT